MSENHHIYMDQTGFVYDVVVTKASVELSRLEKASIIVGPFASPVPLPLKIYLTDLFSSTKPMPDHPTTTLSSSRSQRRLRPRSTTLQPSTTSTSPLPSSAYATTSNSSLEYPGTTVSRNSAMGLVWHLCLALPSPSFPLQKTLLLESCRR